jgi:two-component system alkaline phosphatase synthesis response regulator PhoP
MTWSILVGDDDATIRKLYSAWLKKAGHTPIACSSGAEVETQINKTAPDLILLDVVFGKSDGRALCRKLREAAPTKNLPVILISGEKTDDKDVVSGLSGGADDYLLKPVRQPVLLAKVEAVLRRFRAPKELGQTLERQGLKLNVTERTVQVDSKDVTLTRKEFDLLTTLLRNEDHLIKTTDLLQTVWGYEPDTYSDPHTLQVHVSRLKKKLGKRFTARLENVIGSGYRLKSDA